MTATSSQPTGMQPELLQQGESGEWVTHLQERLKGLGYYDGAVDGEFSEKTQAGVLQLQEATGQERDGKMLQATWQALQQHEQQRGGPSMAHSQSQPSAERQVSPDGMHEWDGQNWITRQHHAEAQSTAERQVSPDGLHEWDGQNWVPRQQHAEASQNSQRQRSPDGHYEWDGNNWVSVHGAQPAAEHGRAAGTARPQEHAAAQTATETPGAAKPAAEPAGAVKPLNIHPAITQDEKFADFVEFLQSEGHGAQQPDRRD